MSSTDTGVDASIDATLGASAWQTRWETLVHILRDIAAQYPGVGLASSLASPDCSLSGIPAS